jgi:hypothetical protein
MITVRSSPRIPDSDFAGTLATNEKWKLFVTGDLDVADSSLTSDDFLQRYISMNRPVIIRQADLAGSPLSPHPGR